MENIQSVSEDEAFAIVRQLRSTSNTTNAPAATKTRIPVHQPSLVRVARPITPLSLLDAELESMMYPKNKPFEDTTLHFGDFVNCSPSPSPSPPLEIQPLDTPRPG